jgi:predicted PurR-regulated permease PerM
MRMRATACGARRRVLGGYVRGVFSLAVLIGVLVGAGLAVLGVPYAMLLGVLAFFIEFVPILGVFISGAAALIIAVVQFRELARPLLVAAYFVFVHIIEGDIFGPRIMGRAVGIHPATGLIALVAGTEVFGVCGALFATPLAGLLQSILVSAWIEFRGGGPRDVLRVVAGQTDASAKEILQESLDPQLRTCHFSRAPRTAHLSPLLPAGIAGPT